ncbi:hypothetical protein BSL78_12835 [Apostichopus japonicus]|uniref:Uncharacterized protein n=1 Tax=Stichopus japonicus TaxID=307972 RepID=A0A2G8KQI3_STIJA|nr:hypothetical protein BSL78_12835 [Apostichopus japonicus]
MKETLPPLGGGINFEAGDKYISVCRGNLAPAGFPFGLGVCPYYPVLGAQQLLISSVPGSGTDSWDPEWNLGSALPVRSRWTRGLVGPGPPEPISVCVPSRVPLLSTRTFCPFRSEFQMGYLLALSLALAFPLGHRIRTVPGPWGQYLFLLSLSSSGLSRRTRAPGAYLCVRTTPGTTLLDPDIPSVPVGTSKGFLLALSLAFLGSEGNVCSGLLLRSRRTLALRSPSLCAHHNGCRSLRPGRTVRSGRLCHGLLVGLEPCPCPSPWWYIRTTPAPWVAKSASLSLSHGLLVGLEPCPCPSPWWYIRTTPAPWVANLHLSLFSLLRPSPGLSPSQLPPTLSLPLHLLSLLRFPPGELWVR